MALNDETEVSTLLSYYQDRIKNFDQERQE
jgi:hypothetical protein